MAMLIRACGTRISGAAYMVTKLSQNGHPLEEFLADLPRPISNEDYVSLGLSSIGVKLVVIKGVTHVFDIIGGTEYVNVADFVEEARRYGISRRVPSTLKFELLGPSSKLVVLHRRAILANAEAYVDAEEDLIHTLGVRICVARHADQHCEKGRTHHDEARDISPCSRLWLTAKDVKAMKLASRANQDVLDGLETPDESYEPTGLPAQVKAFLLDAKAKLEAGVDHDVQIDLARQIEDLLEAYGND